MSKKGSSDGGGIRRGPEGAALAVVAERSKAARSGRGLERGAGSSELFREYDHQLFRESNLLRICSTVSAIWSSADKVAERSNAHGEAERINVRDRRSHVHCVGMGVRWGKVACETHSLLPRRACLLRIFLV